MLNGVEAATLPDTARRPLVGYVEQSFRRVPGTVRDQITLFDAAITPQQAEDAARTVGLHDAIAALPEGYDSPVYAGHLLAGAVAAAFHRARHCSRAANLAAG